MIKICTKCKIEKSLDDFHNCKKSKDGKNWVCKPCLITICKINQKKIKDKINARRRFRRAEDPIYRERLAEIKKKSYWNNKEASLLRQAKQALKRRGISCDLNKEDIILPEVCPIFKIPFDKSRFSPSLDRIDNTKTYTKDNIWIISRLANTMKNDGTIEELLIFCKNMYEEINKYVKNRETSN